MGKDVVAQSAIESWESHGLVCTICPSLSSLTGYVRVPAGFADAIDLDALGATYGPDEFGWVGIDTFGAEQYWAPDDLVPYIDSSMWTFVAGQAQIAQSSPDGGHRWTLGELRSATSALAEALSNALS
ncbi:hypothetical protein [Nocardia tengchongensis]|uniref:hypothetical protein n=1 Tax=Nocardia tengchongensis TaxID=2055889 RepID=UPI00364BD6A4